MSHYREALVTEADAIGIPPDKKVYLEECIMQLENVFDAVEHEYEKLRAVDPSYPPFKVIRRS